MKKNFIHQVSAGGLVFKGPGQNPKVCLISRFNSNKKVVWCLPKGHLETGESQESAALREIEEESGLKGTIVETLGFITYQFFDSKSKEWIFKKVHFFLVRYASGSLTDHDDEVIEAKWFSLEEALKVIEYTGEREILKRAAKQVASYE